YEDGVCYVETMNLDGETNLKMKRSLEATLGMNEIENFNAFKATIRLILSGHGTKVVRNSTRSPSKRSRLERKMDKIVKVLQAMFINKDIEIWSSGNAQLREFHMEAALKGQEDAEHLNMGSSRISSSQKESITKGFNFLDDRLMNNQWVYRSDLFDLTMFFRVMALCHTGIPIEEDQTDNKLKYEAESPEEIAFLIASQEFGFQFCRTQSTMLLKQFDPSSGKEVKRYSIHP
ncbi:hypothetical protein Tsubulata_020139, partial [Turnera subulata]